MALPAFRNEGLADQGHFAPVAAPRPTRAPVERAPSWQQQEADRRLNRPLGRTLRRPDKLPLRARICIIGFGAVLGWAVPIAVATTFVGMFH